MTKLESLTPEQQKLLSKIRDKWINKLNNPQPLDREKATPLIEWLYEMANLKKPKIVYLDSPIGLQFGANMLKNTTGAQVRDQV
jgi:hypothetical protein